MTEIAKAFGKKLRARRTELKLSQDDLALSTDIDRSYIGRIERGEANISLDILYKLAHQLKCQAKDLLP